ncbi:MAG: Hsp20/alpha crystallin family protein [Acidobacteria bacterium]|nr:Hsp20/alpha crystallin family protein [Acidobacteriota bacterium]MCI0620783.1 Hsp20/alpha crystallin family protein [Acidobacteriota bacterium]MCI0720183.1 Hsp20/alpha crystallin family protein [Acidobacteriota bacterium]
MVKRNPAIAELLQLQEEINHLLCDLTVRVSGEFLGSANHWAPNIDLSEDAGEIVVKVEVPGVAQADLEIVFQEGYLQIRGEKRQPAHSNKVRYLCLERGYGKFQRTIYLTVAVDISAARARLGSGVLTITLPKLSNRRKQEKVIPIESS